MVLKLALIVKRILGDISVAFVKISMPVVVNNLRHVLDASLDHTPARISMPVVVNNLDSNKNAMDQLNRLRSWLG